MAHTHCRTNPEGISDIFRDPEGVQKARSPQRTASQSSRVSEVAASEPPAHAKPVSSVRATETAQSAAAPMGATQQPELAMTGRTLSVESSPTSGFPVYLPSFP